jgi:hypothetical protein
MTSFWPAWATAPALGAITVGYWILLRRPLGVSGVLARFSRLREEAAVDRGFETMQADPKELEALLAAMTAEQFGAPGDGAAELPAPPSQSLSDAAMEAPAPAAATTPEGRTCAPTPSLGAHAVFLVAIVAGGLLASLLRGTFAPGAGMGASFEQLVAPGPAGLAALAGGGLLVGFGTALCGGCTAGHGLTGCGRLMPGSLVSTAIFFGAAVGASLLLGALR